MEPSESISPEAPLRRKSRNGKEIVHRVAFCLAFVAGIWGAGELGVHMATNRNDADGEIFRTISAESSITLGRPGDPVYLAESPDALREFFNAFASREDRSSADLTGRPIRRISSAVDMRVLKAEADAVEVRISSGAIAGAVYWVHHSQMPDPSSVDPIISPVPTAQDEN